MSKLNEYYEDGKPNHKKRTFTLLLDPLLETIATAAKYPGVPQIGSPFPGHDDIKAIFVRVEPSKDHMHFVITVGYEGYK